MAISKATKRAQWGIIQMCNLEAETAAHWHKQSAAEYDAGQFSRAAITQGYARNSASEAVRLRLKLVG
jgi:hypothetical protein